MASSLLIFLRINNWPQWCVKSTADEIWSEKVSCSSNMKPRFRAEWVVLSEELHLILASCLLGPMNRNSVLDEFSVRRFAKSVSFFLPHGVVNFCPSPCINDTGSWKCRRWPTSESSTTPGWKSARGRTPHFWLARSASSTWGYRPTKLTWR